MWSRAASSVPGTRARESLRRRAPTPEERVLAMQRGAGNHAVTRLLQRQVVSARLTDGGMHEVANALDEIVQDAYSQVFNEPGNQALARIDGYTRRWLSVYNLFRTTGETAFLHAAFGYAVESVAGRRIRSLAMPPGYTIALQGTRGMTRPDIVIKHGVDDVAWFDITSAASEGHHLLKHSTRWKTMANVAEIVYPALVPEHLGAGALSPADRMHAIANAAEARTIEEKMVARLNQVNAELPGPLGGNNKTHKRTHIEKAIGQHFGFDKVPPRVAKGILALLNKNVGQYGYTGKQAKGRDTETAKELLYGDAVMTLQEGDERAYNLNAMGAHADFNPPTAGMPLPGLFGEPDTITGTIDIPPIPFIQSFAPQQQQPVETGMQDDEIEMLPEYEGDDPNEFEMNESRLW